MRIGHRMLRMVTMSLLIMLASIPGMAFDSSHSSMQMVWNAGSFDCDTIEMALIGDGIWECAAPVALAETYYFQFWPDGSLASKYGADILNPGSLVYDDDPSQVPVVMTENGYFYFSFDEALLTYAITPAAGSIAVQVQFNDTPVESPDNIRAAVVDLTSGSMLGFSLGGPDEIITIENLIPAHEYEITVFADGYDTKLVTVSVPDGTPVEIEVTLDLLVSNQNKTWSGIKTLYR
jgi:hypothetical protein